MKTVPKVNMIHNLYGYKGGARAGSIYDENGLSPSITTMDGGCTQPMITEIDTNKILYVGNIYPSQGQNGDVFNPEGLSPALRSGQGLHGRGIGSCNAPKITETDMANQETPMGITLPEELRGKKFRIRKLTPREFLRLMDVDDADIDKMMSAGLSNSALYKLAGNSIVESVLYHIFRKMFIDADRPDNDGRPTQLTLF